MKERWQICSENLKNVKKADSILLIVYHENKQSLCICLFDLQIHHELFVNTEYADRMVR